MENIRFTNTAFAAIGLQAILVIALVAARLSYLEEENKTAV